MRLIVWNIFSHFFNRLNKQRSLPNRQLSCWPMLQLFCVCPARNDHAQGLIHVFPGKNSLHRRSDQPDRHPSFPLALGCGYRETIGLDLIFRLRGFLKPPPDVVVKLSSNP